jgi:hypothetical protein
MKEGKRTSSPGSGAISTIGQGGVKPTDLSGAPIRSAPGRGAPGVGASGDAT